MNIKVGATTSAPWLSVTNDHREVWGVGRPFAARAGGVGALIAGVVLVATTSVMFLGAPLVAARGSVKWNHREVRNPLARIGVAYVAAAAGLVASIGAVALAAVAIPVAPAVGLLQSVVHAGGRLLGLTSPRTRAYGSQSSLPYHRPQPRRDSLTQAAIPARSVSLAVPQRVGPAVDRELR